MIVVASQLNDWDGTNAKQTIEFIHYFKNNYKIDKNWVFTEGCSTREEALSLIMGIQPFYSLDIYIVQQALMEL